VRLTRRRVLHAGVVAGVCAAIHTACKSRDARGVAGDVRAAADVVDGDATVDGAGVKLRRMIGGRALALLDPFLLLDEFKSANRSDFIRGFPRHPHRGFETVTLMLDGVVNHRDSVGNHGAIRGGGVQWMTAGHGIVHEEMPDLLDDGRGLWGYQLWVNLPAKLKMQKPRYQELAATDFPVVDVADARVRVLAGAAGNTRGPIDGIAVQPLALDVTLAPGALFRCDVPRAHNAFVQVLDGAVDVGANNTVQARGLAVLAHDGDRIELASANGARALVVAGAPIGEPVARRGPFVMNTQPELDQAFADYRAGVLTAI
jgi:redox-sensitive bicupin YhaK (pirin superfamily)